MDKGFASIVMLWILVAATALGSSMLLISRTHRLRANVHVEEVQLLYLAHAGVVAAYQDNFKNGVTRIALQQGAVEIQSIKTDNGTKAHVGLTVATAHSKRLYRTDWLYRSGQWRMCGWQESPV